MVSSQKLCFFFFPTDLLEISFRAVEGAAVL